MKLKYFLATGLITLLLLSAIQCTQQGASKKLPILGETRIVKKDINGNEVADTVYHTIPYFSFIDQNWDTVTPATFKDNIYVADFFFTTCPTICPKMHAEMARTYEHFKGMPGIAFLSHSIDPVHDSVPVLKDYAERLGASADQWHFVTGNQDSIYSIAEYYLVSAGEDEDAPGGYIHSGAFILIDKQQRIRGYYDGTDAEKVDEMITDISRLMQEK